MIFGTSKTNSTKAFIWGKNKTRGILSENCPPNRWNYHLCRFFIYNFCQCNCNYVVVTEGSKILQPKHLRSHLTRCFSPHWNDQPRQSQALQLEALAWSWQKPWTFLTFLLWNMVYKCKIEAKIWRSMSLSKNIYVKLSGIMLTISTISIHIFWWFCPCVHVAKSTYCIHSRFRRLGPATRCISLWVGRPSAFRLLPLLVHRYCLWRAGAADAAGAPAAGGAKRIHLVRTTARWTRDKGFQVRITWPPGSGWIIFQEFSGNMNSFMLHWPKEHDHPLCHTNKTTVAAISHLKALELWNEMVPTSNSELFEVNQLDCSIPQPSPSLRKMAKNPSKVRSDRELPPIRPTDVLLAGVHPCSGDLGTEGAEDSTPAYSSMAGPRRSWWNLDQIDQGFMLQGLGNRPFVESPNPLMNTKTNKLNVDENL